MFVMFNLSGLQSIRQIVREELDRSEDEDEDEARMISRQFLLGAGFRPHIICAEGMRAKT